MDSIKWHVVSPDLLTPLINCIVPVCIRLAEHVCLVIHITVGFSSQLYKRNEPYISDKFYSKGCDSILAASKYGSTEYKTCSL